MHIQDEATMRAAPRRPRCARSIAPGQHSRCEMRHRTAPARARPGPRSDVLIEPFPPWIPRLFALAAATLVPWTLMLALALPTQHDGAHWRLAWVGLDVGLFATLAATAVAAARRSPWVEGVAMACAALLLCDAWFDVMTAQGGAENSLAIVLALLFEIPLTVVSIGVARRTEHALARVAPPDRSRPREVQRPPQPARFGDQRMVRRSDVG